MIRRRLTASTRRRLTAAKFGWFGLIMGLLKTKLTGDDVKAMVLSIMKQAHRDDWLGQYSSYEALDLVADELKRRGIRSRELIENMAPYVMFTILGKYPASKWSEVGNALDEKRADTNEI